MNRTLHLITLSAIALLTGCGGSVGIGVGGGVSTGGVGVGAGARTLTRNDAHKIEVEEWYRGRIERLTRETGWLALVGLFPLENGAHTLGAAADNDLVIPGNAPEHAGRLTVSGKNVHLDVADGVTMTLDGAPIKSLDLKSDAEGAPTEIRMGTFDFYVIDRPGSLYLRVKDSDSAVRKAFKSIRRYPVRRKWKVAAHLEPYNPPRKVIIPNVLGFDEVVECRGALAFKIDGKTYRLEPMSEGDGEMFIVFGDATSGHATYSGGRFVYISSPDENGDTFIDFNRAYNPPCVFTPYATCPLPHAENILPIKVEAGEKNWEHTAHR